MHRRKQGKKKNGRTQEYRQLNTSREGEHVMIEGKLETKGYFCVYVCTCMCMILCGGLLFNGRNSKLFFLTSKWTCATIMPKRSLCPGQRAIKWKTCIGFKWLVSHLLHMDALMLGGCAVPFGISCCLPLQVEFSTFLILKFTVSSGPTMLLVWHESLPQ